VSILAFKPVSLSKKAKKPVTFSLDLRLNLRLYVVSTEGFGIDDLDNKIEKAKNVKR